MSADAGRWIRWAWATVRGETTAAPPAGAVPLVMLERMRWTPVVFAALRATRDERAAPMEAYARQVQATALLRQQAHRDAIETLERAGLCAVVLKGAATLARVPLLTGLRPMADLDVLVAPSDYAAAGAALAAAGFDRLQGAEPVSARWAIECEWVSDAGPLPVHLDLHRALHRAPLWADLAPRVLARRVRVDGLPVPARGDHLLVAAAHRVRHGMTGDGRELLDVYATLALGPMRPEWVDAAGTLELDVALYALLRVTERWLGLPPTGVALRSALRARLGGRVAAGDRLAAWDSASLRDKPWARAPFVGMFLPTAVATGRWAHAGAAALAHGALRAADVVARGPDAAGHFPRALRAPLQAVHDRLTGRAG